MYHDSRDERYRSPFGACPCGAPVCLRILAPEAERVWLRVWWNDREIMKEMTPASGGIHEIRVTMPERHGLYWYYFVAELWDGKRVYYGNGGDQLGGEGCVCAAEPPSYQITVYDADFDTPHWMRNGVMMQIMTDRFCRRGELRRELFPKDAILHENWDGQPLLQIDEAGDNAANDFFGGNLQGITDKLDYIRSMGVTVLYLNPVFMSRSNHKYDTSDYRKIDPSFGTEQDFEELCAKAAGMGIRVILDGVFSHTGADSVYFDRFGGHEPAGAYRSKDSEYASWYRFEEWPDRYDCWWGFPMLPNVNEDDPGYREFMLGEEGTVRRWLKCGASGWRLDVADELPMDFIRGVREAEKRQDPDAALIGEVWEDPSNKVAYGELRSYCLGDTLDSAMNYPLRKIILDFMLGSADAAQTKRQLDAMAERLPAPFLYSQMNLLGSHDRARVISILADCGNMEPDRRFRYPRALTEREYALGSRRFAAAWQLVCALPGMPCLYYGDEAGMTGMSDPFCRGSYPWGREDRALQEIVRGAALLRGKNKVLRSGRVEYRAVNADVLLAERYGDMFDPAADGDESCVLAVNRSDKEQTVNFDGQRYTLAPVSAEWLRRCTCEI